MNVKKIVDLYTKSLQLDNATVFLRTTDKEIWTQLRLELKDTSRADRQRIWEEQLESLVEARYKTDPNAFIVKKYKGHSTYAERWRIKRIKAKWRFVNIFKVSRPKPTTTMVAEREHEVEIRATITKNGAWDPEAIAAVLASLMSQVPQPLLDEAIATAKRRVRKVRAA